jgi:hypothetical protein
MTAVAFTIAGDPVAALSPNLRLHYLERHRRVQDWKGRAWLAWRAAGAVSFAGRVRLSVEIRRGRPADTDNCWASLKACLDGLKSQPGRAALVVDDDAAHLVLGELLVTSGRQWRARPEVLVRVEALAA